MIGALLAVAATLLWVAERRDAPAQASAGGNVRTCVELKGDAARACYRREVSRDLAAVGGTTPRAFFKAQTGAVSFTAAADTGADLLCDLHTRVGVTATNRAGWTEWAQ